MREDFAVGVVAHPVFEDRVIRVNTPGPVDNGFDSEGHSMYIIASICGNGIYKDKDKPEVVTQGTAPMTRILVQSLMKPRRATPG